MCEWETSVVIIQNSRDELLLVHQDYGHHFFGLPGGKVEPGETPADAAIRELFEEAGLQAATVVLHRSYDLLYPGSGSRYRAHAFLCDQVTGEVAIQVPDEISEVGWWPIDDLPTPLTPSAAAVVRVLGDDRLDGIQPRG